MKELKYGFVDSMGILKGTAIVLENDIETLNRIIDEVYPGTEAHLIEPEHIPLYPEETFWKDEKFYPPKEFNSWIWENDSYMWIPPIPHPNDEKFYIWNEEIVNWEEIVLDSE